MFFRLIGRDIKRQKKENGIYFAALVIAIVAFYIVLSLKEQDVIVFLMAMESQAMKKLMLFIRGIYVVSLVIVFFLIFYASRYQMERRSHELGIYLMLGMRRRKVFRLLLAEDVGSSILSLAIGIPVAVLLAELINLITARVAGMSIIGHRFSISASGILWTVIGVVAVKLLAVFILSGRLIGGELLSALAGGKEERFRGTYRLRAVRLLLGVGLLTAAYIIGAQPLDRLGDTAILLLLGCGTLGTYFVFGGIGSLLELLLRRRRHRKELFAFSFRQLQENVLEKPNLLASSSLLLLAALVFFVSAFLFGTGRTEKSVGSKHPDLTFTSFAAQAEKVMGSKDMQQYIQAYVPLPVGICGGKDMNLSALQSRMEAAGIKDANRMTESCSVLPESDYSALLQASGHKALHLKEHEIALFLDPEIVSEDADALRAVLAHKASAEIEGASYSFRSVSCTYRIAADRMVRPALAIIVPDVLFHELVPSGEEEVFRDAYFDKTMVKKEGLMQVAAKVSELLEEKGITQKETYLQANARSLLYKVAACYTMVYLGLLFIIVANATMGIQFLTYQKKTGVRYETLLLLGSDRRLIERTAGRQLHWYFGLVIAVASVSAVFGITFVARSFLGILAGEVPQLILVSLLAAGVLSIIEGTYIHMIRKMSDRYIRRLDPGIYRE